MVVTLMMGAVSRNPLFVCACEECKVLCYCTSASMCTSRITDVTSCWAMLSDMLR